MDEERMPKELSKKITIAILIMLFQAILLSYFREAGLVFVFGVMIFVFMFSTKDKKAKKHKEDKILKQNDWYKSKYKLTKNIP